MKKNTISIILISFLVQSCDNKTTNTEHLGKQSKERNYNCDEKNDQYICLSNFKSEYGSFLWKDQKNGLIYKRECKIADSDFHSPLHLHGLNLNSTATVIFENKLTEDYLDYFGLKKFYTHYNSDTLISGIRGENAWTFNWELENYENIIVDSIINSSKKYFNDSISFLCDKNTFAINNWKLGKDKFETFPSRIKTNWNQNSDYLSDNQGIVQGFRTSIDWFDARYIQNQLEKNLGKAKVVVNQKAFPTIYIWEWNQGIIVLILDKRNFQEPAGKILVHSGKIYQEEFLMFF